MYLNIVVFQCPHYVIQKTFVILASNLDESMTRAHQIIDGDNRFIAGKRCTQLLMKYFEAKHVLGNFLRKERWSLRAFGDFRPDHFYVTTYHGIAQNRFQLVMCVFLSLLCM